MKTTIFVQTEFGDAQFSSDTPEAADRQLKSKLRKIKLSIKKLRYIRETQSPTGDGLHIFYDYLPTRFCYDREKAAQL